MKRVIFFTLLVFSLTGCSHKTAFSVFDMSKEQKVLAANTQRVKLLQNGKTLGIINVTYLNNFHHYKGKKQVFFIALYLKNKNQYISFLLNNKTAIYTERLPKENQYTKLLGLNEDWNQFYKVVFNVDKKILLFSCENTQSSLASLTFLTY